MSTNERTESLRAALGQRILVLDGAMGTAVQARDLTPEDFGGPQLDGCNEHLVLTRPVNILDNEPAEKSPPVVAVAGATSEPDSVWRRWLKVG